MWCENGAESNSATIIFKAFRRGHDNLPFGRTTPMISAKRPPSIFMSGTRELNPDCYAPNVTGSHTPPSLLFGADGGIRTLNIYLLKIARLPIAPHRHTFLQSQLLHPDWIMVLIREPPTSFEEMSSCQRFNELAMNLQGDQIPSNSMLTDQNSELTNRLEHQIFAWRIVNPVFVTSASRI